MNDSTVGAVPVGLEALNRRVASDLQCLNFPPEPWVATPPSRAGGPYHVVVIGAGMLGLTACFALQRLGIHDVTVLDAREAGLEGPWRTYARMRTLRSPKHLTGPAQGMASLTFRAWYEAQWGGAAWDSLGRIPREMWMDYLVWYREVLSLPVRNGVRVEAIEPLVESDAAGARFALHLLDNGRTASVRARKVVLATGREGLARPRIPAAFAGLDANRCQHSAEHVDFEALRGRRVAVVGLGASALDNAAEALEAGAERVELLGRAPAMPRLNKGKAIGYPGFTEGFPALPAERHLAMLEHIAGCRIAPPRASLLRVAHSPAFSLRLDSDVVSACERDGAVSLTFANGGSLEVDHVVLGTGFRIDLHASPLLAPMAEDISRWRDRVPDLVQADGGAQEFLDFPFLGDALEFQPRRPGTASHLAHLHCFNYAAAMSHGHVSGDIPAVSDGAERLARGIARSLFVEDAAQHWQRLLDYADPELLGDELPLDAWWPPLE